MFFRKLDSIAPTYVPKTAESEKVTGVCDARGIKTSTRFQKLCDLIFSRFDVVLRNATKTLALLEVTDILNARRSKFRYARGVTSLVSETTIP